jgi:16S rRNA (cytidine1402-2'-O)-methyltransferase
MSGTLYVVASPIGNPEDMSPRALVALREADVVLAEDTRTARALLGAHGIERPVRSCFDANEDGRAVEAVAMLRDGQRVAILSEAGTPSISDPGYRVVRAAIEAGARVVPIPGPSAVITALVASGLPTDRFAFLGFPPRKPGPRRALFQSLRADPGTLVFYEAPTRAGATLAELAEIFGQDRPACLARELTKIHEELVRDNLGGLARRFADDRPLGEVTLVVGGAPAGGDAPDEDTLRARASALLGAGLSPRDAAQAIADEAGIPRKDAYRIVLDVATGARP